MRAGFFLLIAGSVMIVIQTTSIGFLIPMTYKPDLILVLVVWAALRVTAMPGVAFAYGIGLLMDLLSGGPRGLFAVVYAVVFVTCGQLNARLNLDGLVLRSVTILLAMLFCAASVLTAGWVEGPIDLGPHAAGWIVTKAVLTACSSLLLFPCVDRVWAGYGRFVGVR